MTKPAVAAPLPPLVFPVTVIVDTREQRNFTFEGFRADAELGYRPLVVRMERKALYAGDYSLATWERSVAIERKSLTDLYGTLGRQLERFVRELQRLQETYTWAAVVVEAGWEQIIRQPPERSNLKSKTVFRSILARMQRYPKVHWIAKLDRRFAEICTFRLLERWVCDPGGIPTGPAGGSRRSGRNRDGAGIG